MKKLMSALMGLAVVSAIALPAAAQERNRNYSNHGSQQVYRRSGDGERYNDQQNSRDDDSDRNGRFNRQSPDWDGNREGDHNQRYSPDFIRNDRGRYDRQDSRGNEQGRHGEWNRH